MCSTPLTSPSPALCFSARPLVHREEVKDMRDYEVVYIIKPGFDDEKYNAIVERYNTLIQNNGGEIVKVDLWGKRRLAYEIEKLREGYYVLVQFKAETALPEELERNLKIADDIMRYLVVRMPE